MEGHPQDDRRGRTWHAAGPPIVQDGYPAVLVVDPAGSRIAYSADKDGLLKTTDGGGSWRRVGASLPRTMVSKIALDPTDSQTIYAVLNNTARLLFVSRNGGRTWQRRTIRKSTAYIPSIAFDPHQPGAVYAGTPEGILQEP